jgi:hypothetical protein
LLHARVAYGLPPAPPCRVDRELVDGDVVHIGVEALVVATPDHTLLGPFNLDRERAAASLRVLAELDADVACFGHGQPVVGSASAALAAASVNLIVF